MWRQKADCQRAPPPDAPMVPPSPPASIIILAGGAGRRIGGAKHLRLLNGQPLIQHMIELARLWGDPVLALGDNPALAGCAQGDQPWAWVPIIADAPDIPGPLGGVIAGLHYASTAAGPDGQGNARMMLLPVDTPLLPHDLFPRLVRLLEDSGQACAVPQWDNCLQIACSIWDCEAVLSVVDEYVASGRYSIRGLAERAGMATLDFQGKSEVNPFLNINDSKALSLAESIMTRG